MSPPRIRPPDWERLSRKAPAKAIDIAAVRNSLVRHTIASEKAHAIPILKTAGVDNPRLEVELLLAHACDMERVGVIAHPERELSRSEHLKFRRMSARRSRLYPLAYLLKKQDFWGMELEVNPAVLIPRPETETLVEAALEFLRSDPARREFIVADVGTGSGAIAIALARELPGARIIATDISAAALRVARRNAKRLGILGRGLRFLKGDKLIPALIHGLAGKLDAVCSNPPYVPSEELRHLQPEVAAYEPRIATDGGEDGLAFYEGLAEQSLTALRHGGRLFVEVGVGQAKAVEDIFTKIGLSVLSIERDLQKIERVVIAERKQ